MKNLTIFLVCLLFGELLFAQSNNDSILVRPKNNISINLLGDASLVSVNYERLFVINPSFFITAKLGIGYNEEFCLFGCDDREKYLTIPQHITGNFGKGKNFFEFGLGGSIISGHTVQDYTLYPMVGYRLQPLKSDKLNFRVYLQYPVTGSAMDEILFIPIGFSFGYCF